MAISYSIRIAIHVTFVNKHNGEVFTDSGIVEFPSATPPEDVLLGSNVWATVWWLRQRYEMLDATSPANWALDTVAQRVLDSKVLPPVKG